MDKPDNYYEGILQLRDVSQEVVDFVEDECTSDPNGRVAKIKQLKNGFDFYMQNNQFLGKLGKKIKAKFSGELLVTTTLHTRNTKKNKDLYRVTVLFREIKVKKGDVIELNGERYEVAGVGDKILSKEEKTGKKKQFKFCDLAKARIISEGEE